jgi:phosphoribosyl-AMP cyclohydrolase
MDFPYDLIKYRNIDGIDGLILAIAQDAETNEVLMVAFTNKEGIEKSVETGKVHYYSTSRKKLWLKGETSGHFQKIKDIYIDCDADAILFKIEQTGAACHEGYRSCFFRRYKNNTLETCGKKVADKN